MLSRSRMAAVRLAVRISAIAAIVALAGLVAPRIPREAALDGQNGDAERKPDSPDQALRWRLLSLQDENGFIPADGLARARAHMDEMRARGALDGVAAAGIGRGAWTWLGPGNIGGRTRTIAIHPNGTTVFAGTVGGGIWVTHDGGSNWAPVDDFLASLAVTTIVFKPGDPLTLFAGTGEGFFNADAIRGAGIFKSSDGGVTWSQLASTRTSDFFFVNRLAFSADGFTLLAGTTTGLFRSTDAGATWTKVLTPTAPPGKFSRVTISDVKFLAGSSVAAVASGFQGQVYVSSNAGVSWTPSAGLGPYIGSFNRVELGITAKAPNVVYAVLDYTADASDSGQFWKSTDGGFSFGLVSTPGHLRSQGWYDNAVWIDPTNENHIVLGGVGMTRSFDGGATFTAFSVMHVDHHAIVSHPAYNGTTNRTVFFGNDGGVYKMTDVTVNSATSLNNNFGVTQFYGAAGHPGTGRITGGTQDNGTLFYSVTAGPQQWKSAIGGDGGFSAYDPTDANYFYGEFQNFGLHRNSTGGVSFSQSINGAVGSTCKLPPYVITDACNASRTILANFIAPFILDPNVPTTLLAGGASLWRTTDAKAPLTATTGPMWAPIKPALTLNNNISAIAVAPGNSDTIWVGHNSGELFRTTNGTAVAPTWTQMDPVTMPNRMVTRIAIDPSNPNVVYASFGSFAGNNLWKTTNAGATWADSTGSGATGLPDAPIRSVLIHPTLTNWVYVGTEVGIFASTDGGATWALPHDGPANASVDELFWMGTTLVAATHGRGLYKTTTSVTRPSEMNIDRPASGVVTQPFTTSGWALNRTALIGTGVDAVHVYAFPTAGTPATFLGVAAYGAGRGDVGQVFGPQFINSGWSLAVNGLTPGGYMLIAYAHNAATGAFDFSQARSITISPPVSAPAGHIDIPSSGSTVPPAFRVAGWSLDTNASSGSGVDAVHVYAFPAAGTPAFLGVAAYGHPRPDVGNIFGSGFTNSGYHLDVSGLAPGSYNLVVYSRSTVTGTFNSTARAVTVRAPGNPLMTIDTPGRDAELSGTFAIAGWAIDLDSESGPGVDAVHVWAYRSGGGAPVFLGAAELGFSRADVGAVFGERFTSSGYNLAVPGGTLGPGVYSLVVFAHSSVSGGFHDARAVTITVK